ncbi:MAG: SprT family zinc-dependent metalloprotease [Anaerolineaceae bacterium]|nr:SprT family zinc-dependent metalloprotease [Anaerolineaceae bacterium]
MAIRVTHEGPVVVRAPLRTSEAQIRRWVETRREWVEKKLAAVQAATPPAHQYANGEAFLFQGRPYPLRLTARARPRLAFDGRAFTLSESCRENGAAVFQAWYREQARRILPERTAVLAQRLGVAPGGVRLSGARTRWGSCSARGQINLNWRLVMAPPEVLDYVIVHELAHLKVRNHSKTFWALVESWLPGYAVQRRWLKDNGLRLNP